MTDQSTQQAAAQPATPKAIALNLLNAIGALNLAAMPTLFAQEIEWFVPGADHLPWTGRRKHRRDVTEFFATMWPHYVTGKSSASVDTIVCEDEHVVITGEFSHVIAANGQPFTTPIALHLKIRGEQIHYLQLYEDTLTIAQAFGQNATS